MALKHANLIRVVLCFVSLILGAPAVARAQSSAEDSARRITDEYRDVAQRIIRETRQRNEAFSKLQELCYTVGHRLSGSDNLERAIDWAVEAMRRDGQENVRKQRVMVPRWVRGNESLTMLRPRKYDVPMLGLGGSVATPPGGIRAEVVVARDREALERMPEDRVRGKIVLFTHAMQPYTPQRGPGYGPAVRYRHGGAAWAAEKGAVACLIRSVTATSLRSPHTGSMGYGDAKNRIPGAAVTVEDAIMIDWLLSKGEKVEVELKMEARDEGMVPSANVIGELRGRELPDEVVVIGGHIDSWDVGQGAHDDGSGCVMSMEAINVLRHMNLIPRRTIRVVLFTNEENGTAGAEQYAEGHRGEMDRHVAAIEADSGGFRPTGFSCGVDDAGREAFAAAQMKAIVDLMRPLGTIEAHAGGGGGADVGKMKTYGVPVLGLDVDGATYFDYHHTHADTVDKVDPAQLTDATAAMAVAAYILADMPDRLGGDQ
jgi:carboxypeptidase Q